MVVVRLLTRERRMRGILRNASRIVWQLRGGFAAARKLSVLFPVAALFPRSRPDAEWRGGISMTGDAAEFLLSAWAAVCIVTRARCGFAR